MLEGHCLANICYSQYTKASICSLKNFNAPLVGFVMLIMRDVFAVSNTYIQQHASISASTCLSR